MTSVMLCCADCSQPIEGVLLPSDVERFRAFEPMAEAHQDRYGHWPMRVRVHPSDDAALRRVDRKG